MISVRTTLMSFAIAGAASVGTVLAQGYAPVQQQTPYSIYQSSYFSPTEADPAPAPPSSSSLIPPQSSYYGEPANGHVHSNGHVPGSIVAPGSAIAPSHQHSSAYPSYTSGVDCSTGNCGTNYQSAVSSWDQGYGDCGGMPCLDYSPLWYASVSGLIMTRDRSDAFWTSYDQNNNHNQIMNSRDASLGWSGGIDTKIGRQIGCNSAIELGYFGVWGMSGRSEVWDINDDIGTPLDVTDGNPLLNGNPAALYFDNARSHRIDRSSDFHNIELNYIHGISNGLYNSYGQTYNVSWLGGFRYFRFEDEFGFSSLQGGSSDWYSGGGANVGVIESDVVNSLYGFQLGARFDYQPTHKFGLFVSPKIGIFGNHIETDRRLGLGNGYTEWEYSASKTDFSFLAQVDAGVNYRLTDRWNIYGGYRAVAVTGVALSDRQIPHFLADTAGFQEIHSSGSVILHGAFAGVEYRF